VLRDMKLFDIQLLAQERIENEENYSGLQP
jgi:hypothetical protein